MALADDFLLNEDPVILIELDFDSGAINFWTSPFSGEFGGKSYSPIAGLTGAFALRRSLDNPSLNATAQITGSAGEILNAALTENFQGRAGRIRLANLNSAGEITNAESQLSGTIEDIPIIDSVDGTTSAVQLESVFARINRVRDLRFSAADQKKVDPSDTFFDFVSTVDAEAARFGG